MTTIKFVDHYRVIRYVENAIAKFERDYEKDPKKDNFFDRRSYIAHRLRAQGCYVFWAKKRGRPPTIKPKHDRFFWSDVRGIGFKSNNQLNRFKKWNGNGCKSISFNYTQREEVKNWLIENVGRLYYNQVGTADIAGVGWEIDYIPDNNQLCGKYIAVIENPEKALEFVLRFA